MQIAKASIPQVEGMFMTCKAAHGFTTLASARLSHSHVKIYPNFSIFVWNTQGTASRDFLFTPRESIRRHDPKIMILVEWL